MIRKTASEIMLTLLTISMLALTYNPNLVQASPETILYIDPPTIPFTAENGYFNNLAAVVSSTLDIRPDTLNLDSNGRWITAYVELPDGYDVGNIDCSSIRLGKEDIRSGNLVTNGGFEDGLNGWTTGGGGTGYYSYVVANDGTEHPDALEYERWASGADGGSAGVWQDLDILVSDYDSLYLELDVEVISNSLQDSGWWSYQYGGYGEFPVAVFIRYEDSDGNIWNWNYNFFPSDNNEYFGRTNFSYVDRNAWYHYVSPNLADVTTTLTGPHNQPIPSPTPYRITSISVGGTGWDFNGRVDNVNLWGTTISDGIAPASHGQSVESAIGDYDEDSIPDLMVKFDRASIVSWIYQSIGMQHEVTLAITGELTDGTPFEGTDTISVVYSGGGGGRRR